MKLKFLKTTAIGNRIAQAGTEVEVEDRHAAELYIAHGQAKPAEPVADPKTLQSTLRRSYPVAQPALVAKPPSQAPAPPK